MKNDKQLQPILELLRPFRWMIVGTVLLAAATVLANVGLLAISAVLISLAALQPPLLDLMVFIVGVRFFGISRALLRYSERYVSHKITFQILTKLRVKVYQRIEPTAPAGIQQYSYGQLFDRLLNDIEVLKYFYLRAVLTPAAAIVVLIVCSIVLAQFQLAVMVLFIVLFLLFGLGVPLFLRRFSAGKTVQLAEEREQWQILLEDYLGGLSELKNTGQQQQYYQQLLEQLQKMAGLEKWLGVCSNITTNLISYGSNLSLVLALMVVIPAVAQGSLSGVYCAMILLIIWSSFEAILPFPQAFLQLQQSMEAAAHIAELPTKTEMEPLQHQQPGTLDLKAEHLAFAYENGHQVYQDFSFYCQEGAHIALVGTSGSGKSTLASLLVRFWEPQQGTVTLGDVPIKQYPEQQLRALIGVVEQETFLFSATVRENLLLANPQADEPLLHQALNFAVLDDVITALPDGLDTDIGDNGYRLSGGQRQRISLARAWLRDCPIVILDEVFQGLDALTAQQLRQHLAVWGAKRTMIYITHSLQQLQDLDCIYVMQQGDIIEQGKSEELLQQKNSVFYQMWQIERQQIAVLL